MTDQYYKVTEVAQMYKVTRQAVYKWINDGRLRAVRVGSTTRIKRSDLEQFERVITPGEAHEDEEHPV